MISYGHVNEDFTPEKVVWDQYRVWKRHAPAMYSHLTVYPLEWPALSLDWLPEEDSRELAGYSINYLLMGTHAHPPDLKEVVGRNEAMMNGEGWEQGKSDAAVSGQAAGAECNHVYNLACTLPTDDNQGFSLLDRAFVGRVTPKQKLAHPGEVNCIKHMPQNPHVIATRGPCKSRSAGSSAPVYIYYLDMSQDLMDPNAQAAAALSGSAPRVQLGSDQAESALLLQLTGHKEEGFTLSWNKKREGLLASGADDGLVLIWGLEDHICPTELAKYENGIGSCNKAVQPLAVLKGHEAEVQGVDFHPSHQHLLFSVSDDRTLRIWDTRLADKGCITTVRNAHSSAINCVQVHPFAEHVVATGGKDIVKIWDIRFERRSEPTMMLRGHAGEVTCLEWAPHSETVLATGSADRSVIVWDIEKHTYKDRYDSGKLQCCPWIHHMWSGPPAVDPVPDDMAIPKEVLFVHFGHTAPVTAVSWNPNEDWFVASASQDNILHVWKMADRIRVESDDEDDFDETEPREMRPIGQAALLQPEPSTWEVELRSPAQSPQGQELQQQQQQSQQQQQQETTGPYGFGPALPPFSSVPAYNNAADEGADPPAVGASDGQDPSPHPPPLAGQQQGYNNNNNNAHGNNDGSNSPESITNDAAAA